MDWTAKQRNILANRIHLIASGSRGNCIIIETPTYSVMLDAGVDYDYVFNHLKNEGGPTYAKTVIGRIAKIIVSHEHGDHDKHSDFWLRLVYDNNSLHQNKEEFHEFDRNFKPFPFPVKHDVLNLGIYFYSIGEIKDILWFTDAAQWPLTKELIASRVIKPRILLVEANHLPEQLMSAIYDGSNRNYQYRRHLNAQDCATQIEECFPEVPENAHLALLHLTTNIYLYYRPINIVEEITKRFSHLTNYTIHAIQPFLYSKDHGSSLNGQNLGECFDV